MTEPRERPILFSGPMVRAILEGRKTQTRRIITLQPNAQGLWPRGSAPGTRDTDCPYGQLGDRLWVRETWGVMDCDGCTASVSYAARLPEGKTLADTDGGCDLVTVPEDWRGRLEGLVDTERWRPSIHMPRWASRLTLEVTGVRVERLQTITQADALAEGTVDTRGAWGPLSDTDRAGPRGAFEALWNSINGLGAWDTNPWVWVVEFRRLEARHG